MRKYSLCFGITALVVSLTGCGSSVPTELDSKPQTSRLGDSIDISLAELLAKPRKELAEMADEWTTKIHIQEQGHRTGKLYVSLLAEFRLPLVVPIWRESKYSSKAGFSLPPYVKEESRDNQLALHLARYGDLEAARKLIEHEDAETLNQVKGCALERNYPLEWTRLAGLLLHAAQLRLATGDVDGGTEVVVLHRQLRELLGPKAAQSALGASLLARGRETLARAECAWREDKKTELADQARAALAQWGEVSPPHLALKQGTERPLIQRVLGSTDAGMCLLAPNSARALDVLELPFPDEGVAACLACLDEAGRLAEVFVTYKAGQNEHYAEPSNLAHLLEESQVAGQDSPKAPGLRGRSYQIDGWTCEVTLVNHGAGLGAFVRFSTAKSTQSWKSLTRDFGAVHLDRTFEQNRLRSTPEQRKDTLATSLPAALARVTNLVPTLKPQQLVIQKTQGHDLTAEFSLEYNLGDNGCPPLHQLALPLWTAFGAPQFQGTTDARGGHLALVWEDKQTRYSLRLPYENSQPAHFEVQDQQAPESAKQREAAAHALDSKEWQARMQAKRPLMRIPRQQEQLELGMTRAQILQILPTGQSVLKRQIPGGMAITFVGEPASDDKYVVRELFVRFDKDDRAVELRGRYADGAGPGGGGNWKADLLKALKKQAGAPLESPAPWASIWKDTPGQKSAARLYSWHDDLTLLTYQIDAGGSEVTLLERPVEHESGFPLPPLESLPRGPEGCLLGMNRETIAKSWRSTETAAAGNEPLVLRPVGSSSYDAIFVWFEKDLAARIVARHVQAIGTARGSLPPARAVSDAWAREARAFGWPRKQDMTANDGLQALGWHDDLTRVRIFWQENDNGSVQLFTEWTELPKP